jgi:hypothetical protein
MLDQAALASLDSRDASGASEQDALICSDRLCGGYPVGFARDLPRVLGAEAG